MQKLSVIFIFPFSSIYNANVLLFKNLFFLFLFEQFIEYILIMIYPPSTQDYPHLYSQIFSMVRVVESTRASKGNNPLSLFPPLWTDTGALPRSTFLHFVQWHQSNTCCILSKCMLALSVSYEMQQLWKGAELWHRPWNVKTSQNTK